MLRIYPVVLEVLKQLQPALRQIERRDRDLARQLKHRVLGGRARRFRVGHRSLCHSLLAVAPGAGRSVGSLGVDAEHLVWLEGSQPDADPEAPFKVRDVYVAKPTSDPLQLKPRRVRSFPGEYVSASRAPAVGCGYAAFQATFRSTELPVTELFIVKLSDGSAWRLRTPEGQNARYSWGSPLAVTCDEVFVPMADNVRRIPFASLGPPLPQD